MNKPIAILLISCSMLSAGHLSYADEDSAQNDALEVNSLKVSMLEAVRLALNEVQGRPTRAQLEDENGVVYWSVEIVSPDQVIDLTIDAATGQVMGMKPDNADEREEVRED